MRVISIQQPWAWLIANGYKTVENRTWETKYRGPIHIHAGKKHDDDGEEWVRDNFPQIPLPAKKDLPHGGIVGLGYLAKCARESEFPGDPWAFGPYCFKIMDSRPLPFMPIRGQLGIFYAPDL